jgi:ATP-dependent exoDNAse (exonuclease V) beta subunit
LKKFNHIDYEYPALERITNPDGSRVYKTPTGRSYPSVTTVTGLLKKKQILEWRKSIGEEAANEISRKAANRGTRIHRLCEKYLLNEQVNPSYFDSPMWESIKGKLDGINNIYALEQQLYSDHLQIAGTVDCVAEYENKLSVIDFKTSKRLKVKEDIHDYFMQCSAYAVAFEERTNIPVSKLVVIMAIEDEDTQIFVENRDTWIGHFVDLREEYRRWKNI